MYTRGTYCIYVRHSQKKNGTPLFLLSSRRQGGAGLNENKVNTILQSSMICSHVFTFVVYSRRIPLLYASRWIKVRAQTQSNS